MTTLLVIGLGNPGTEFAGTRHNVGARTAEILAERNQASFGMQKKTHARIASVPGTGTRLVLAIPTTYMNESGRAAAPLVRHYLGDEKFPLGRVIVVHDDLDLDPGTVRVKLGGGTAGHNGLKSIGQHLHAYDFVRVRIGVGKPPGSMSGADYVLRRLSREEREELDGACERAADAVETVLADGVSQAMTVFNAR